MADFWITVSPIFIVVLTAYFGLMRYLAEQWWRKKAETYKQLLSAVFKVYLYADHLKYKNMKAAMIPEKREEELLKGSYEGENELRQISAVDSIYLDPDAERLLEKIIPEIENSRLPKTYIDGEISNETIQEKFTKLKNDFLVRLREEESSNEIIPKKVADQISKCLNGLVEDDYSNDTFQGKATEKINEHMISLKKIAKKDLRVKRSLFVFPTKRN